MASKSVQKIDIELLIKGSEQLSKLKGSFRDLLKTVNQADAGLESARQSIIEYGKGANNSISVIRGQVSAFKALQDQAKIGGKVFKNLAVDIALLKKQLKQAEDQATRTEKALSFKAARGRFISQTPGALIGKIDQLRGAATATAFDEKGNLNKEYIEQQQQLNVLTKVQIRLEERLALKIREGTTATVDNNNQNKTAAELLSKYGKEINTGTLTSARLSQRLRELKEDFQDLTVGSKEYVKALRSISFLENKIADPFKTSARKAQIRGRLGQQETFGMFAGRDPVQSSIDRRERKRSRRYNGFSGGGLANQPLEASDLFKNIAGISGSGRSSEIQMMGKSYEDVSLRILAATRASNGSISSLNQQRAAWVSLRDGLSPASKNYDLATDAIERTDRALQKSSRNRRKFSAGQAAQVAGATISGGIFGGPEGFLGGAIGGAIGGVGGSFAGAALGAQLGGLRKQLGGFADYAASIKRLKIALGGITEVQGDAIASQGNYARAVAAAANVTKELNVPQEVAIKGITRLTAAVKGAGGGVADAELAFKNIAAAITATGGGAEQVEGAVTALVQIFSKGKVSAEEINQIAERLPGTFNKIAEASGRTGPELTKALQKGEVGLNDLMKFLVQLGGEYGELAKKIAGSSESAGARLTVAYNNMRIEIGKALQPVGAEFQQAFGEFLEEITPAILAALPSIRDGLIALAKNLDLVAQAAAAALAVFVVGKIAAIIASIGSLSAAFFTLKLNAIVATKALVGLNAAALLNPYTALAAGAAALAIAINRASKEQNRLNLLLREGSVAAIDKEISEKQILRGEAETRTLKGGEGSILSLGYNFKGSDPGMVGYSRARDEKDIKRLTGELRKLEVARGRAVYDRDQGADLPDSLFNNLSEFPDPTGTDTGGGGGGGGGGKAEEVRKSLLDSIMDQGKLVFLTKARIDNELKIGEAQKENNRLLFNKLNNEKIAIDFAEQAAQVELQYRDALRAAQGDKNEQAIVREESLKRENATNKLIFELEGERTKEARRFRDEKEAIAKASEDELFNLRDQLGLVGKQERIDRFRQSRIDAGDPNAEQQTDLYRQTIDPTLVEGLTQNIAKLKKDLDDLVDPINQITGAANAIGSAFSSSFMDAITGAKSAKEALADFFSNVGSYFLDMATQIIAKMVTLAILNAVVGLLPGGNNLSSFGGGTPAPGMFTPGGSLSNFGAGIPGFAKGGYVTGPTNAIIGEGSEPEYVIPESKMRESMNRYSRGSRGGSVIPAEGGGGSAGTEGGTAVAAPIDVRYTVERINSVDYVTADQFQAGMRKAAEQGASQGEQRTFRRLKMSSSARRGIGI